MREATYRRHRSFWTAGYVLLAVGGFLLRESPLPTLSKTADPGWVAFWHYCLIIGALVALVGARTRRPILEVPAAILAACMLGIYTYSVLAYGLETHSRTLGGFGSIFALLPLIVLNHALDVYFRSPETMTPRPDPRA